MKIINRLLIAIALILLVSVFAQGEEEPTLIEAFRDDPSPENFNQLPSPTASDLERVSNPTLGNFQKLGPRSQQKYLLSNYRTDFAQDYVRKSNFRDTEDKAIAERFFSESAGNVNNNKNDFAKYLGSEGITIDVKGNIKSYSKEGLLVGANQDINIREFKDKYSFEVDAGGNLKIIDKGSNSHDFEGSATKGTDGNIQIDSGKIDGQTVTNGRSITISEDGTINGKAQEFGGLTFEKDTVFTYYRSGARYLVDGPLVFVSNAKITSVSPQTDLVVSGKNIILPDANRLHEGYLGYEDGQAYVPQSHVANINLVEIDPYQNRRTNVYFDGNKHPESDYGYVSMSLDERRVIVDNIGEKRVISPGIISGGTFDVRFHAYNRFARVESEDEFVRFILQPKTAVTVQNRDAEGLIPKVVINTESKENLVNMQNGQHWFVLSQDRFDIEINSQFKRGSVPMSIEIQDLEGNNKLGTAEEPKKWIITNKNKYASVPLEPTEDSHDVKVNTYGFSVSEKLKDNYDANFRNLGKMRDPDYDRILEDNIIEVTIGIGELDKESRALMIMGLRALELELTHPEKVKFENFGNNIPTISLKEALESILEYKNIPPAIHYTTPDGITVNIKFVDEKNAFLKALEESEVTAYLGHTTVSSGTLKFKDGDAQVGQDVVKTKPEYLGQIRAWMEDDPEYKKEIELKTLYHSDDEIVIKGTGNRNLRNSIINSDAVLICSCSSNWYFKDSFKEVSPGTIFIGTTRTAYAGNTAASVGAYLRALLERKNGEDILKYMNERTFYPGGFMGGTLEEMNKPSIVGG